MSTRGTYKFTPSNDWYPNVTLYNHWDNYPEGAATFFYKMLMHGNQRGGEACRFLRANSGAEITHSHEAHGDTEYRYDLDGSGPGAKLTVWERDYNNDRTRDHKAFKIHFVGVLADFIAKHSETVADWYDGDYSEFRPVGKPSPFNGRITWHNLQTAKAELDEEERDGGGRAGTCLKTLRLWIENGNAPSGNSEAVAGRVKAILDAFPELTPEDWDSVWEASHFPDKAAV